jgi:hypothetical protein
MTATGMLERILLLYREFSRDPDALELRLLSEPEEAFLPGLLREAQNGRDDNQARRARSGSKVNKEIDAEDMRAVERLTSMLLRRDLYERVGLFTYAEAPNHEKREEIFRLYADGDEAPQNRAKAIEQFERAFFLPRGSVAIYAPESRMNSKIAQVALFVNGQVKTFDKHEQETGNELSAGHLRAQLERFKKLWRMSLFIDPAVLQPTQHGDAQGRAQFIDILDRSFHLHILGVLPGKDLDTKRYSEELAERTCRLHRFRQLGVEYDPDRELIATRTAEDLASHVFPSGVESMRMFFSVPER